MDELIKKFKELKKSIEKLEKPIDKVVDKFKELEDTTEGIKKLKNATEKLEKPVQKLTKSFDKLGKANKAIDKLKKSVADIQKPAQELNKSLKDLKQVSVPVQKADAAFEKLIEPMNKVVKHLDEMNKKEVSGLEKSVTTLKDSFLKLKTIGNELVGGPLAAGLQRLSSLFKKAKPQVDEKQISKVDRLKRSFSEFYGQLGDSSKLKRAISGLATLYVKLNVGIGFVRKFGASVRKVIGVVGAVGKAIVNFGTNAVKVGIQGFKKFNEALREKIKISNIVSGLSSLYGKVADFTKKFGDKDKIKNLSKAYNDEFNRITSVFKPVANALLDFAIGFVKGFKTITKAAEPIISIVVNLGKILGDFFKSMFNFKEGTNASTFALESLKNVLDFLVTPISYIALGLSTLFQVLQPFAPMIGILAGVWAIWNVIMSVSPITWIIIGIVALVAAIAVVMKYFKGWGNAMVQLKMISQVVMDQVTLLFKNFPQNLKDIFMLGYLTIKSFGEKAVIVAQRVGKAVKLALKGKFSEAKEQLQAKITTKSQEEIKKLTQNSAFLQGTSKNIDKISKGFGNMFDLKGAGQDLKKLKEGFKFPDKATSTPNVPEADQGIANITDGGKKQTHINVHFDKLVENITIQTQTLKESVNEMEDEIVASLLRVLNSANQMQA